MEQSHTIGPKFIHHYNMFKISFDFDEVTKKISNISIVDSIKPIVKRDTTGKAIVEVTSNKLIISDTALALLDANPEDRISINYFQESKENTFPLIAKSEYFTDKRNGNKLTKSNTVSFRGNQRTLLLEYGTIFELQSFKEHIFKLVPINDNDSEIVSEELKDEEQELDKLANDIITNSIEDSLPIGDPDEEYDSLPF